MKTQLLSRLDALIVGAHMYFNQWFESLFKAKEVKSKQKDLFTRTGVNDYCDKMCEKAKLNGRKKGDSPKAFIKSYEIFLLDVKTKHQAHIIKQKAKAEVELTFTQKQYDSFNKVKRAEQIIEETKPKYLDEKKKLENKLSSENRKLAQAEQARDAAISEMVDQNFTVDSIGYRKLLLPTLPLLPLTSGVFDFVVTSGDFINSAGRFPIEAYPISFALSGALALTSHKLGASYINNPKATRWYAFSGIALQVLLTLFRGDFGGFDNNLFLTSGFIYVFFGLGAVSSRYRESLKKRDSLWRKVKKADKEIEHAKQVISETEKTLNNLDTIYQNRAAVKADREFDALGLKIKGLTSEVSGFEMRLSGLDALYGNKRNKDVSKIELAFEDGKSTPFNGLALSIGLLAFMVMGCGQVSELADKTILKNVDTISYDIFKYSDKSGSLAARKILTVDDYAEPVLYETIDIKSSFDGVRSAKVSFYVIGQESISSAYVATLKPSQPYLIRNVVERDKELKQFEEDFKKGAKQSIESEKEPMTKLHRNTSHGFKLLSSSKATDRHMFIWSDFIECGSVDLSKFWEHPKQIREHHDELVDSLLLDYPLPVDLSGIYVHMNGISERDYHTDECKKTGNHTKDVCTSSNDNMVFYSMELFQKLWEARGAKVIIKRI